MNRKPLKKARRVLPSAGSQSLPSGLQCLYDTEQAVTSKKRYSRPEVDKLIADAMPEQTPYDLMVDTRREFDRLSEEITSIENQLRHYCNARKECEKRLAALVAKVKSTAEETQP
jgi:CII-binding regulator of phage lambda lysogenization HflD